MNRQTCGVIVIGAGSAAFEAAVAARTAGAERVVMLEQAPEAEFGGVEVNSHAQVMNVAEQPIRGLYESGDILGLFFHNYPSFTGPTRNAVFSRLAGEHAVRAN